jgi:hypothetical protein
MRVEEHWVAGGLSAVSITHGSLEQRSTNPLTPRRDGDPGDPGGIQAISRR